MKISTRTRYGTRLMVALGLHYETGPVYLKNIAKQEDISEKYLTQIIMPLKNAGLVNSFRGAYGGYFLSRHPAEITIREIVEVLNGGFSLVWCVGGPRGCMRAPRCVTRDLWSDLGEHIAEYLDEITLEDMVKRSKDKQEKSVMYTI